MTLAPGETFEHTHLTDSVTLLVEGSVDLVMGDSRTALVVGQPTRIPAGTSHVLINTGHVPAAIECSHQDEPVR